LHTITNEDIDEEKKLTAVEFVKGNGQVQSDLSLDPVAASSKWNRETRFLSMTLLTDDECANISYIENLKTVWEEKPTNFTGTDENLIWLSKLDEIIKKVDRTLISNEETISLLNEIEAYIKEYEGYGVEIYRYLEPKEFANRANWFLEIGDTATPAAVETGIGIEPVCFKELNTEDAYWVNKCTEGVTENILQFQI